MNTVGGNDHEQNYKSVAAENIKFGREYVLVMQFGKDFKVAYEFEKTTFLFREKRFAEQVVGSHSKVVCKTLKPVRETLLK